MARNKEKNKKWQREYYHKRKNEPEYKRKRQESAKKYYLSHREEYLEKRKKYWETHKEQYRKYRREWRYKRPEGIWEVLRQGSIRRGKLLKITRKEFIEWWNKQEKICFYCGVSVDKLMKLNDSMASWCKRLTIDRLENKKPYQIGNMVLACRRCNAIKGDFFTWQEMKEIGQKYVRPKRILDK